MDCKRSRAFLIDDGPDQCSERYVHTSWLRRFNRRRGRPSVSSSLREYDY
ncbi:hypothetical protein FSP39_012237 [Pinctada imbricata]|uniref:Uncharacterized protein n=1 Tax=Pinctada imbricata TaxID=66713 RepID=A0AA89BZ91_PINIB|nr:hypothetical protein FSP39_012237 [Pinctada imbricata]